MEDPLLFLLVLRCGNLKCLGTPRVANEEKSLKKKNAVAVDCSKLSPLGLNWFMVQSLFLVTSLSRVRVQSCERAKKLDLGVFVSFSLHNPVCGGYCISDLEAGDQ